MPNGALRFPLFERAERAGVLEGGRAVIVGPTATGKSYMGREAICRAVRSGDGATNAERRADGMNAS
jgi:KaiC/GvpD/RAD55 family RecA-like ATPase